jgi:hypothetical protein
MPKTVIGIGGALAAIKALGWDQVEDGDDERIMVDDITLDPNTDDVEREYVIDGDTVTLMRDGFRSSVIWTLVEGVR